MQNQSDFVMHPIGVIHTPFTDTSQTPIQSSISDALGQVEVYPEFADGLQDVEGFSHVHLLYAFHCSAGHALRVKPFLDDHVRGLFATRHPCRPNPIGMSVVRLIARRGNVLEVEGVDMFVGTPLLDIKPYVPDFDVRAEVCTGWYATRSIKDRS
jgi:tRNA-Thr(GGU) m(6)t(6)A37 methyltransferase TsaA